MREVLNPRGKVFEVALVVHDPLPLSKSEPNQPRDLLQYRASPYKKQSLANESQVAAMADIGVIGGVLGMALSALHIAQKLKELIDGIRGATEAVKALSKDLHALQGVLEALNSLLEDSPQLISRRLLHGKRCSSELCYE